jgi:hypothetical protein
MVIVAEGPSPKAVLNNASSASFRNVYASWLESFNIEFRAESKALVTGPKSARVKFASTVWVVFCDVTSWVWICEDVSPILAKASEAFCDVTSWGSIPPVIANTMSKLETRAIEIVPQSFVILIFNPK